MPEIPFAVYLLFGAPISAILLGFFVLRPWRPQWIHWPILASCAVVCAATASLAARVSTGWGVDAPLYSWLTAGDWGVSFGVRLDGLSVGVLSMVTFVGGLIHVYASGYMRQDPGFPRFFLLFHFFFLSMIGLLVSNSYAQLYLFWELVGAASYLLIGFWHHKRAAREAALQAFMTNRVGDFGLLFAVLMLMFLFRHGTTRFAVIFPLLRALDPSLLGFAGVLIFWAACAKSAQFPLYFWLPDAMEGPTPVSALMHAATMVTAGIFLLARSWPLVSAVDGLPELIGWVGAFTALASAVLAGTRTDLKRILAYSTVSHLGLMAFALGLGAPGVAVFHLLTHGFFKAALFLCAGNIAHALGGSTASVSEAGGLRRAMPLTFACFVLAACSLAGVWPFAGFYSKDAILDLALHAGPIQAAMGLAISAASSFYIFRMLFLAFLGPRSNQAGPGHAHEAEPAMSVPLVFLAGGAVCVGWLKHPIARFLTSGWPGSPAALELPELSFKVSALGTGMMLLGAGLAYALTTALPDWDWDWRKRLPGLEAAFDADFGWKRVVKLLARWTGRAADGLGRVWDKGVWDGLIEGSGAAARSAGQAAAAAATGSLNDYLWWMLAGTALLLAGGLR